MRKESWKIVKFKDVVDLKQGLAFNSKNNHLMAEEGIPLLRIVDLNNNSETKFVNSDLVSKNFISKTNDIIYSRTGAQLGLVYTNRVGIVHNNCFRIIPHKGIHNMYLYWYLKQPVIIDHARNIAGGAAQPDLNHTAFKSISFTYPENIKTQQKIATILSSYDELIENNKQRIKLLEEMAEEIYKEWFVRLRFPGYENTKIIEGLPEGWENGTIGDLVEFKKGKNITLNTVSAGNIPVVAGGLTPAYYHNVANTVSPTITISASGANAGFVNLYYEDIWVSDCSYLDTNSTKNLFFFYLTLKTRQNEVFFLQKGSAQPHVYPKDIMTLKMKKPSIDLIEKFEGLIVTLFEEIKILSQKNQLLQETRDLLLPRLISGKLSVEHLIEKEGKLMMVAEPGAEYKKA